MEDTASDLESAYYTDDDAVSLCTTLPDWVHEYEKFDGRTYHAFGQGRYPYPNDEAEVIRLRNQHSMLYVLTGRLHHTPAIPLEVLDLGTGYGAWAIDIADQYECANVLGVDLSPIQPTLVPNNVQFEVFDFARFPWGFPSKFNLIFGRMLAGSVGDLGSLLEECKDNLHDGGWVEFVDWCPPVSDDNSIPQDGCLREWTDKWCAALREMGRDPYLGQNFRAEMSSKGFVNVRERRRTLPMGPWMESLSLKRLGEMHLNNVLEALEGFTTRLFKEQLGMTIPEIRRLLQGTREEMQSPTVRAYWPVYVPTTLLFIANLLTAHLGTSLSARNPLTRITAESVPPTPIVRKPSSPFRGRYAYV